MTIFDAIILGIVEGLTEFLPISSTAHLIVVGRFLKLGEGDDLKAFQIIIQSGAIAAVLWHYRKLIFHETIGGLIRGEKKARGLFVSIVAAFIPAAVVGLVAAKWIKTYLFGIAPVVCALAFGGILMIVIERLNARREKNGICKEGFELHELGILRAIKIGLAQCLAMWPGMSRSMTTIIGGRFVGLSIVQAAEFSFLLAVPTLLAAGVHDAFKERESLLAGTQDPLLLLIGLTTSFITALIVIRLFLKFLTTHSMEVFGWYRIGFAGLVAWLWLL